MFVVVIRPDRTLNVRVVGPFRSRSRAEASVAGFDALDEGREPPLHAEVVEVESHLDVWRELEAEVLPEW